MHERIKERGGELARASPVGRRPISVFTFDYIKYIIKYFL